MFLVGGDVDPLSNHREVHTALLLFLKLKKVAHCQCFVYGRGGAIHTVVTCNKVARA
jgi:hypothetical protein